MLFYPQLRILRSLNAMRRERCRFTETELYNRVRLYDRWKMVKFCEGLQEMGYITLSLDPVVSDTIRSISLTAKGASYSRAILWDCVFGLLRWFFNNLVAIAALVVSLVALLHTLG